MNTAHFWQGFQRLFLWSVETLRLPPMILIEFACIVSVVAVFIRQRPFRAGLWRPTYWLIFTQLLFFPATVAVGVLFPAVSGRPYPRENPTGQWLLNGLLYLSLVTSAFWVYRMKGLRWLSISLLALQQIILAGAGFIAGMSVSGDWL